MLEMYWGKEKTGQDSDCRTLRKNNNTELMYSEFQSHSESQLVALDIGFVPTCGIVKKG